MKLSGTKAWAGHAPTFHLYQGWLGRRLQQVKLRTTVVPAPPSADPQLRTDRIARIGVSEQSDLGHGMIMV